MLPNDFLVIVIFTLTVNFMLFIAFYFYIFKKINNIKTEQINFNKDILVLINLSNQQINCLEHIYNYNKELNNLIERILKVNDPELHNKFIKNREILSSKDKYMLKLISELKLFSKNMTDVQSSFNTLISHGDLNTLDIARLRIRHEKDKNTKKLLKEFYNRLIENFNKRLKESD